MACFDPFGLDTRGETVAEAVSQTLLAPVYPSEAGSHIALVETRLSDPEDPTLPLALPLSPAVQAELVHVLAAAHVRAIFIDAEYRNPAQVPSDDDLFAMAAGQSVPHTSGHAELAAAIVAARKAGIPVLIGPVAPRRDLQALASAGRQTGVSWSADHPADYALHNETGLTAAADLYRLACASHAPFAHCSAAFSRAIADRSAPAMALRFGAHYPPEQWRFSGQDDMRACQHPAMLERLRRGLIGAAPIPPCTDHLVLPVVALLRAQNQIGLLNGMLRDRIVLIGAGPGQGDDHVIPGFGTVPGIAIHAAALDNLLTWGSHYPRWPPNFTERLQLGPDEILKLLALLGLAPFLTWTAERLSKNPQTKSHLARHTILIALGVGVALTSVALVAIWLLDWPVSVAIMIAGLCTVAAELLSGEEFHRAIRPFMGPVAAWLLVGVAMCAVVAILFPPALPWGLLVVAAGIGWAARRHLRLPKMPPQFFHRRREARK